VYNLLLYERVAVNTASFRQNITHLAHDWRRSIRAVGGFWTGDFTISAQDMSRYWLIDFYNNAIGWRIVEKAGSKITWEGEIVQLRLSLGGVTWLRSLDTERWHNKVSVIYPAGQTAWSEDTDSSGLYGESCYIDTVSGPYDATAAAARRDRRLIKYAFPRSWASGGLSRGDPSTGEKVSLDVLCAGYVFSINRRYRTTDTAAANVSAQISTLVGESEFVSAGTIDTNTLQVPISTEGIPTRLWDIVEELIGMGDAAGAEWVGGVYAGRVFDYKAAATTVTYYWRNHTLYDAAGNPVLPTHIKPDTIVELANAPRSQAVPGATTKDQPNRVYIEQVEFVAPDIYILTPRFGPALEGRI